MAILILVANGTCHHVSDSCAAELSLPPPCAISLVFVNEIFFGPLAHTHHALPPTVIPPAMHKVKVVEMFLRAKMYCDMKFTDAVMKSVRAARRTFDRAFAGAD